ncbi:MAG TPA: NAD(P)/FAD-dependent oxidoreductase [Verrucomicrobiae bacterium]|nr:NAD(P)/FAD-dependent oxidoreductase [Verrucomicrobiae bacterium]
MKHEHTEPRGAAVVRAERIRSPVIIVGGGLAGLSAAIYLGRARRETLVIDSGKSMARWEPDVQNYLGFPNGIEGEELLQRARDQARRYHVKIRRDEIFAARKSTENTFLLKGDSKTYECRRLLLATGIYHLPPEIPQIKPCLGHSLFFCKDCDGFRVRGQSIAIYGWTNETVEYALAMMFYSSCVSIVTDGHEPRWDRQHTEWIREYELPVYAHPIIGVARKGNQLQALKFSREARLVVSALFTTRGDIYFNRLAQALGAEINRDGEITVDLNMRTTVPGLYAAGCVTPANCQMIIAAGQGATAAQAINRDLFMESLTTHSLRRFRGRQLRDSKTRPAIRMKVAKA